MQKLFLFSVLCFVFFSSVFAQKIDYVHMVHRLADLEYLATLPQPGEKGAMWSSYDRKSRYDQATGRYENWDANSDGLNQHIRKEGENVVMAEMFGPGAIVRIWSAMPEQGHVKIYLDENPEPVVDLPFEQYFSNQVAAFSFPELAYESARGKNCYIPITYQKYCKVVAEPGWGNYFHFNYVSFPPGTIVEPFKMDLSPENLAALEKVNDYFAKGLGTAPYDTGNKVIRKTISIPAGKTVDVADIEGEYAITEFRIRGRFDNPVLTEKMLRKLVLKIFWDNEKDPAVWSPVGDFFGSTPGLNPYKTLPLGMTEEGMYSFWYMPFARRALVRISNMDETAHELDVELRYRQCETGPHNLARFHAKWHGEVFPPGDPDRRPDWRVLKTRGSGRFVGMMLHVLSPQRGPCVAAAGAGQAWWGEGDEKFFIDGEKFPSTFGTGTEDYFGYAWGTPDYFQRPFHSQSKTMNNRGHQTLNRFQIIDNVPFMESFDGFIEKYYPNACGTKYDCTVYWYLSTDGVDPHGPVPVFTDLWVPAPRITPGHQKFMPGESVEVSIQGDYEKIYYTLDGSRPLKSSRSYSGPLKIDQTAVLKARVITADGRESAVVRGEYVQDRLRPAQRPEKKTVPGIFYAYYEGEWLKLPDFEALNPVETGVLDSITISVARREEDWGMRFCGWIKIPRDGMYTFYLNSDDGSRLFIGGERVVDNDLQHAVQEKAGRIALKAGLHRLKIVFFEAKLDNILEVRMAGPGMEKQLLPADILFIESSR